MPSASYNPGRPIVDLDDAAAALRTAGHRFSASRRAVLEGLLRAEGPVSAEYLASGLGGRAPSCDLPSVYRNLELLERLGMVRHVHIGHGPGLYALVDRGEHSYLVCESCDELDRLPPDEAEAIRALIARATGFEAHFTHFPILGLCRRCAGAANEINPMRGAAMSKQGDEEPHSHDGTHAHEHAHGGESHAHPHDTHDHDHVEHDHEHSHTDRVHAHPHVHQEGLEDEHAHSHDD